MKKLLTTLSISLGSVILFSTGAFAQGSEEIVQEGVTLEGFVENLEEEAKTSEEAQENLDKFHDLTDDEQSKLIDYLNDPTLFEEFVDVASEPSTQSLQSLEEGTTVEDTKEFKNGDVVIRTESEVERVAPNDGEFSTMAYNYDWRATKHHYQGMFGIDTTKLSTYVDFDASGKTVTRAVGQGYYHSNYNPGIGLSGRSGNRGVTAGNQAWAETFWTYTLMKYTGVQQTKRQTVYAHHQGAITGGLENR